MVILISIAQPPGDNTTEEPTELGTSHDAPEDHDTVAVTAPKHKGKKPKTSSKSKKRGKRKSPSVDDVPVVAMEMTECSSDSEKNLTGNKLPTTPLLTPAMSIMSDGMCYCVSLYIFILDSVFCVDVHLCILYTLVTSPRFLHYYTQHKFSMGFVQQNLVYQLSCVQ